MDAVTLGMAQADAKKKYVQTLGPATADDTLRIQAALTRARQNGGGTVVGMPGENYQISSTLIIGSSTTLDFRSSRLTLKPGSNCQMVANYGSRNAVATATDGAVTAGSNVVTTSLAAQAQVGQYIEVDGGMCLGRSKYIGMITAVTSNTVTVADMDGITPYYATNTVSGKNVRLGALDTYVKVYIGFADRGGNGPDGIISTPQNPLYGSDIAGHSIFMRGVEHLLVDIYRGDSTHGISFVWPTIARDFDVWFRDGTMVRTALQVVGPAYDGRVHIVRGHSNDDLVNFCGNVYPDQTDTCGNVRGITVGEIMGRGLTQGSILKLNSGQGLTVDRIKVTGRITGSASTPIFIGQDAYYPETTGGTYGTIDLGHLMCQGTNNVIVKLTHAVADSITWKGRMVGSQPILVVGATAIKKLVIDCDWVGNLGNAIGMLDTAAVNRMILRGSYRNDGSGLLSIYGSARIDTLQLEIDGETTAGDHAVINVNGSAFIDTIDTSRARMKFLNVTGLSYLINAGSGVTVRHIKLGGQVENGNNVVRLLAGCTAHSIHLNGFTGYNNGRLISNAVANLAVIIGSSFTRNAINAPLYAEAATDVYGQPLLTGGGTQRTCQQGSGGVIRPWSPAFKADLANVSQAAGAQAFNTNAALACGVGACTSDGTRWKNNDTGAVYTP